VNSLSKKIIFTGGGSAGHVTVNLALIPKFVQEGWEVRYIGSENGIERELIAKLDHIPYVSISTGKLRRYFDWNNIKDPIRVIKGIYQAYRYIKKEKPNVIFSKGGFVSVPVIIGAWLNRIPVITHESDLTPGLANRISVPFVTKVCTTFPETTQYLGSQKGIYVGAIIREELCKGVAARGLSFCGFTRSKPILLIMGGSLGARSINQVVRANLNRLIADFQIVHICGKGQIDPSMSRRDYRQYEYLNEELPDIMAMADLVVTRAGSNSIFEFLALRKPMLLIPLPKRASRGDQILNAQSFQKSGYGEVLYEEDLTDDAFVEKVFQLYRDRSAYITRMEQSANHDALQKVIALIKEAAK